MEQKRHPSVLEGVVRWIGRSAHPRAGIESVDQVSVTAKEGILGDHHGTKGRGNRQVTLIQWEHLNVVSQLLDRPVNPEDVRRNIVVSGVNLFDFQERMFFVGSVCLQGTGLCDPCLRMEENLGAGGLHAMQGHGGITARVIGDGIISVGDVLKYEASSE